MTDSVVRDLSDREIHVWSLPLASDGDLALAQRFSRLLSPDETGRAARFTTPDLARAFVVRRGSLRLLLGAYTGVRAGDIRFAYGERGKPEISGPDGDVRFSTSHSFGLAILCFTRGCPVGIDLEKEREFDEMDAVARIALTAPEYAEFDVSDRSERIRRFYRGWTRKEAFVKATGEGLRTPMDRVRVTLRAEDPPCLVDLGDGRDPDDWCLNDLKIAPGYAAALAYEDSPRRVRVFGMAETGRVFASPPSSSAILDLDTGSGPNGVLIDQEGALWQ